MDRVTGHGASSGSGTSLGTTTMYVQQTSAPSSSMPGASSGYQGSPINSGLPGASPSNADAPTGGASVNKLTEVFMTASIAFQRLGDITMQITASAGNPDEMKWSEKDAEKLSLALKQFADECEKIQTDVRSRTGQMIKTDFKRRTVQVHQQNITNSLMAGYNPNGRSPGPSSSMAHYNGVSSNHSSGATTSTYGLTGQKRPATGIGGSQPKRIISSGGTTFRTINSSSLSGTGSVLRGSGGVIRPMGTTQLRVIHAGEGSGSYAGHRVIGRSVPASQYYEQIDPGTGGGSTASINRVVDARSSSVVSNASGAASSNAAPVLQQMTATAASNSGAQY